MSDPRMEIGELWRRVNRATHDRFRLAFHSCGQPMGALFLLRRINSHPGVTVSELARQTEMVKSHVSKLVDQLCQQGFVEKRPDQADQRLVRIHATDAGERMMTEMEATAHASWMGVVNEVPEGQLGAVMQGLSLLLEALERANAKSQGDSNAKRSGDGDR